MDLKEMLMKLKPILLVEDTPDDIELTRNSLKEASILNPVVVAEDGEEALDYLFGRGRYADRDPRQVPALILLDLKLPKVDGIEVLKELRASPLTRLVPTVMLTTSKEEIDMIRAYESGVNAYVRKPVSFGEFSEAVKKLGMFWLLLNEVPQK